MSVLESIAKTTRQVIDTSLGTEDWDLEGLGITKAKVDFEKPMWVQLDIAQTRERIMNATIALQARTISSQIIHNKNVNDTRDEANRLLDELVTVICVNSVKCSTLPSLERIRKIKEVLNSIYHKDGMQE